MDENIKKLLDIANGEIGYLEKATNNDLDSKQGNAGSANYTKYARDCFPELQGLAWCCMFVWWCFEKAFGKIMARNLIGEKTAKCSVMKERMLANGCVKVNKPNAGDIVVFNSGSGINHIGIVSDAKATTFSTIEGNTSRGTDEVVPNGGGVFSRAYKYDNYRIDSFIRPLYSLLNHSTENIQVDKVGEINATNINIRSGAGINYSVVGMESKPTKVEILGIVNGWYKIKYSGDIAYVLSRYVNIIDNSV